MSSFLGGHSIVIDKDGRFNVPAKFKNIMKGRYRSPFDENGSKIVICSKGNYLMISPQMEWDKVEEEMMAHKDSQNEEERIKMRNVFFNATEGEIKSGKILLPPKQREEVGIGVKEEAVLIGMAKSFEVWSKEQWAKYPR